jgi:hypothetical protein
VGSNEKIGLRNVGYGYSLRDDFFGVKVIRETRHGKRCEGKELSDICTNPKKTMNATNIHNRVFTIRGMRVMVDFHLSELYSVETKALNQGVKRNPRRFPEDFMFQLTEKEWRGLKDEISVSNMGNTLISKPQAGMRSQIVTAYNVIRDFFPTSSLNKALRCSLLY